MSASPVARQAVSHAQEKGQPEGVNKSESLPQAIPRRVVLNSASEMPSEYSTTPGGTIFSTTPGGTRIIYERAFLLSLKNSPLAQSPPKNLPLIPGVTKPATSVQTTDTIAEEPEKPDEEDEVQFQMEL